MGLAVCAGCLPNVYIFMKKQHKYSLLAVRMHSSEVPAKGSAAILNEEPTLQFAMTMVHVLMKYSTTLW